MESGRREWVGLSYDSHWALQCTVLVKPVCLPSTHFHDYPTPTQLESPREDFPETPLLAESGCKLYGWAVCHRWTCKPVLDHQREMCNQGLTVLCINGLLRSPTSSIPWFSITCKTVQFSSVQSLSRVRLCDPMNRSTPGLPVHHQLPESPQIHIHWVGDAIQPSHPLSSPSPPAPKPSQHQRLFQWVNSSQNR